MTRTFEEARVCPGFRGYFVTESGKVGRIGFPGYRKPCRMKRGGYLAVSLWQSNKGKLRPVHQLVALAFLGDRPSPDHHVAHNDGNKENNHWTNLRWATRKENEADKILHGTTNRGERNGQAKLTNEQTQQIKDRLARGERPSAIARDYPVTPSAISQIKRGARRAK